MNKAIRLMIVDDEPHVLTALRRSLMSQHHTKDQELIIETFQYPEEALVRAHQENFDLVLSDYSMPIMTGVELLSTMRKLQPNCVRIILSAYTDLEALICAINEAQISRFISKPWMDQELYLILQQALEHQALLIENQHLADLIRIERGRSSYQEAELRRLEAESPGITRVKWGPNGEIMFDEFSQEQLLRIEKLFQSNSDE